MTVINRQSLLVASPIKDMATQKLAVHGVSYGLSEAGYDIRIKQTVHFQTKGAGSRVSVYEPGFYHPDFVPKWKEGKFILASTIEEFDMPNYLVGEVKDKSTWARRGLSVFNTVIEPGWKGFLTLELVYHGSEELIIPAGAGIAQVIFSNTSDPADYGNGKYQNAADKPQEAILVNNIQVPLDSHSIGKFNE